MPKKGSGKKRFAQGISSSNGSGDGRDPARVKVVVASNSRRCAHLPRRGL
jgi:hypothetical protein